MSPSYILRNDEGRPSLLWCLRRAPCPIARRCKPETFAECPGASAWRETPAPACQPARAELGLQVAMGCALLQFSDSSP